MGQLWGNFAPRLPHTMMPLSKEGHFDLGTGRCRPPTCPPKSSEECPVPTQGSSCRRHLRHRRTLTPCHAAGRRGERPRQGRRRPRRAVDRRCGRRAGPTARHVLTSSTSRERRRAWRRSRASRSASTTLLCRSTRRSRATTLTGFAGVDASPPGMGQGGSSPCPWTRLFWPRWANAPERDQVSRSAAIRERSAFASCRAPRLRSSARHRSRRRHPCRRTTRLPQRPGPRQSCSPTAFRPLHHRSSARGLVLCLDSATSC